MPIIVLTTAAGAPGASTTALGLTLSWPGPALLVEADPAGTSLVPGWFRGAINPQARNIVKLALVDSADDLAAAIFDQAISLGAGDEEHQRLALLGFVEPVQAKGFTNWWEPIGSALQSLSAAGYAVIVDAGRLTQGSYPTQLLAVADQVLLVCRAELAGVLRSYPMAIELKTTLTETGNADALGVVAIGNGGNRYYSKPEIAKKFGARFALAVPDDPLSAAALSDGRALPPRLAARIRARFTRRHVADGDLATAEQDDDFSDIDDPSDADSRAGIKAYVTAQQADSVGPMPDTADPPGPAGEGGEDPRVIVVPAKLMRAYRAVARESAHRAEKRLARLLSGEPTE